MRISALLALIFAVVPVESTLANCNADTYRNYNFKSCQLYPNAWCNITWGESNTAEYAPNMAARYGRRFTYFAYNYSACAVALNGVLENAEDARYPPYSEGCRDELLTLASEIHTRVVADMARCGYDRCEELSRGTNVYQYFNTARCPVLPRSELEQLSIEQIMGERYSDFKRKMNELSESNCETESERIRKKVDRVRDEFIDRCAPIADQEVETVPPSKPSNEKEGGKPPIVTFLDGGSSERPDNCLQNSGGWIEYGSQSMPCEDLEQLRRDIYSKIEQLQDVPLSERQAHLSERINDVYRNLEFAERQKESANVNLTISVALTEIAFLSLLLCPETGISCLVGAGVLSIGTAHYTLFKAAMDSQAPAREVRRLADQLSTLLEEASEENIRIQKPLNDLWMEMNKMCSAIRTYC